MGKYKIIYQGKEVGIERLPNGKFKIPPLGQFTKQGLGSTWLDDGRIPYDGTGKPSDQWYSKKGGVLKKDKQDGAFPVMKTGQQWQDHPTGRFPANLLCGSAIDLDIDALLELQQELKDADTEY